MSCCLAKRVTMEYEVEGSEEGLLKFVCFLQRIL